MFTPTVSNEIVGVFRIFLANVIFFRFLCIVFHVNMSIRQLLHRVFLVLLLLISSVAIHAQRPQYGKMSTFVRQLVRNHRTLKHAVKRRNEGEQTDGRIVEACVFIRIKGDAERLLKSYDGRILAEFGDIYIATLPLDNIEKIAEERGVERVEASMGMKIDMDTTALCVNALPVYEPTSEQQAFTGKGVLIGVQDIGFDLTHPNFYNADATSYRIRNFWDQLSPDTIGSGMYVGRTYDGQTELLALGHSTDGCQQSHGTHTAGIAAGAGYGTPYRGIAYESELCLVANAVSSNLPFIDAADVYKHTSATDALGFKYIFDYADKLGMPCVISFSEGSHQYFYGDDLLYYEVLRQLTGPGRIIVASAGNEGEYKTYVYKPRGVEKKGSFMYSPTEHMSFTIRTNDPFDIRVIAHYDTNKSDTMVVSSRSVIERADSVYSDTTFMGNRHYAVAMEAYKSCYDNTQTCYDVIISCGDRLGTDHKVSVEWIGKESEIEVFRYYGFFLGDSHDPELDDAIQMYSIHSPSSAPDVICVGGSSYRTGVVNINGEWREYNMGMNGQRGNYSSVGPTLDGRVKPDVMAPGMNVISSYSSFVLEDNPDTYDLTSDVLHTDFKGRTYPWVALSGTSMSTPVVSGAIALWLEARPTLTPAEVMEVLSKTCSHYDESHTYPNIYEGYGQIDVYKGLLAVLGINENDKIFDRVPGDVIIGPLDAHTCRLTFKQEMEEDFTVEVFSQTGQKLLTQRLSSGHKIYDVDLTGYPKGIYIVQVKTKESRTSGSTLIRI